MNQYNQEQKRQAEALADELRLFVDSVAVEQDNDGQYFTALERGKKKYIARRAWEGHINFFAYEPVDCNELSNQQRLETHKKHEPKQRMKKPTQKKVTERLDAVDKTEAELLALTQETRDKVAGFLQEIENSGEQVQYSYSVEFVENSAGELEKQQGAITGGHILKNGVLFEFEIEAGGHIRKKVSLHYGVENTLEAFQALANNQYNA